MKYKKINVIVIDSFGIGQSSDASEYGDAGADTFGRILQTYPNIQLDNLYSLGLGELHPISDQKIKKGVACKLHEASCSKDTMSGHWEMMGLKTERPFKTFTDNGFPKELVDLLEEKTGHTFIGNKSASGTEILKELAMQEIESNSQKLILYTSADSVLQICGHEEVTGLQELYRVCEIARELTMRPEWMVGRVIARPYKGNSPETFARTPNRRDYALSPSHDTALDLLKEKGFDCIGIGKISDIFNGKGITKSIHSDSSVEGMKQTIEEIQKDFSGILFTNLVDFDAKWGHRRNVEGYAQELEAFDVLLGELLETIDDETLLIITADHGNDPGYSGTDHTRECVPCLFYDSSMIKGKVLPDQESFGIIGATIADNFGLEWNKPLLGQSILDKIKS